MTDKVSTHSRPKAAGNTARRQRRRRCVSTHSRPKAAGVIMTTTSPSLKVSTHSRPKAAGTWKQDNGCRASVSTHSRPKAAGRKNPLSVLLRWFQHTAARRRLGQQLDNIFSSVEVSTHSRPKAAGAQAFCCSIYCNSFNTQPPEGGWANIQNSRTFSFSFNTQPPEGGG